MRKKASRKGDPSIDFFKCRVVIFLIFPGGLLNCIYLQSSSAQNQESSSARLSFRKRLTSADSGLQLDLEIALGGVSAKVQPLGLIHRAEDKLKRRMT